MRVNLVLSRLLVVASAAVFASDAVAQPISGPFFYDLNTLALCTGTLNELCFAAGAAVYNLGYTPLNPANNLSDLANASAARSNLGLGSMATQSAAAVAITGGAITGLPSPSNPTDAAIKSYVDSAVASAVTYHTPVALATTAALPANTYANGTAGVGATLTANSDGALTVDGTAVTLGQRVLVQNEVAPANDGVYTETTLGTGSVAYVLTRATDFNQSSNITQNSYFLVTGGTANIATSWVMTTSGTITVGTTGLTFTQTAASQSYSPGSGISFAGNAISVSAGGITSAMLASGAALANIGTLGAANGGTGNTTNTAHAVLLGEGTSPVGAAAIGTGGRALIDQGAGVDAAFQAISGDATLAAGGALALANTSQARTDLGLGSMATQSAGAVAITGGSVTGLPAPAVTTDAATKLSVDVNAEHQAVSAATGVALPSNTYANGSSGVGATLTATANAALTIDGVAVLTGQRVLVQNEGTAANNGVYVVTNAGSGSAAYVLTRATDFNQAANILPMARFVAVAGSANSGATFYLTNTATVTVGTTALIFGPIAATLPGTGLQRTGNQLALSSGAAASNLGFTPLNPANNLSDVASGSAALGNLNGAPQVTNTTALRAASTASYPNGVWRLTDGVAGSAPLHYGADVGGVCAADDGGRCVAAANSGAYWLAQFPPGSRDVRWWGAPSDGATDAGAAINACLAAVNSCLIPTSTSGFFVNTATHPIIVPLGKQLIGEFSAPSAPGPNAVSFAGQSWLLCASTASTACVSTASTTSDTAATVIRDLTIAGTSGAPASGEIGFQLLDGYNSQVQNVYTYNHDVCFNLKATGPSGIASDWVAPHAGACQTYYWQFDGWAEARIVDARTGSNGGTDYAASAWVNVENTACASAGCGPNGIQFVNSQFNPGGVATEVACGIMFSNVHAGYNQPNVLKFIGDHFESLAPSGSFICSDSTVTKINTVVIEGSAIDADSGSATLFGGLNAATVLSDWHFTDDTFNSVSVQLNTPVGITWGPLYFTSNYIFNAVQIAPVGSLLGAYFVDNYMFSTLTITPASTGNIEKLSLTGGEVGSTTTIDLSSTTNTQTMQLEGNNFDNNATFKANASSNQRLTLSGNTLYGTDTISGAWGSFTAVGNVWINAPTNTATGNVVLWGANTGLTASGGGSATKYVCVDANNKVVIQSGAC